MSEVERYLTQQLDDNVAIREEDNVWVPQGSEAMTLDVVDAIAPQENDVEMDMGDAI